MIDVRLGDRVRWDSAAGAVRGEVINAIAVPDNQGTFHLYYEVLLLNGITQRICGSESYLNLMNFSVRFRDKK